jgi:hypothetical protein
LFRAVLRMRHLASRRRMRRSGDIFAAAEEEEGIVEADPSGDTGDTPNTSSSAELVSAVTFLFPVFFPVM